MSSFNTLEEQAEFIEDARREWRQEEEAIEETGFQVGTVRWDPMLQPNETAGYLVVEFEGEEYAVQWESVSTSESFLEWWQFPVNAPANWRAFLRHPVQLDDFFRAWFRVWEWKRKQQEAQ